MVYVRNCSHSTPSIARIKFMSSAPNSWEFFFYFTGEPQLGILFEEEVNKYAHLLVSTTGVLFPSLKIPVPMPLCGCHRHVVLCLLLVSHHFLSTLPHSGVDGKSAILGAVAFSM